MQAYRTGYTSIMIDGSHGSFEENVAVSKAVADACAPSEFQLKQNLVKLEGKEDDLDGVRITHIQIQHRLSNL